MEINYEVISVAYHNINRTLNTSNSRPLDQTDVQAFIESILNALIEDDPSQKFQFERESTEVISLVNNSVKDINGFVDSSDLIAARLLSKESEYSGDFFNPATGDLLQCIVVAENKCTYYLILKLTAEEYVDRSELKFREGFNKKTLQKSCIIEYNTDGEQSAVYIHDHTNPSFSAFWWFRFLELTKLNTDQKNTKGLFDAVNKVLRKELLNVSNEDYHDIKNATLTYLRSHSTFSLDTFNQEILSNYIPQNKDISFDSNLLIENIHTEVTKKGLDTHFAIDVSILTAKKYTQKVNTGIEIKISNEINSSDYIVGISEQGKNYLKIETTNDDLFKEYKQAQQHH